MAYVVDPGYMENLFSVCMYISHGQNPNVSEF